MRGDEGIYRLHEGKTLVAAELAIYGDRIGATFEGDDDVKVLAAYGKYEVLEDDEADGIVIAEFPTFESKARSLSVWVTRRAGID